MKLKTSNLTDRALDYAVALAEGAPIKTGAVWIAEFRAMGFDLTKIFTTQLEPNKSYIGSSALGDFRFGPPVPYSTGPAGDDIIDREKISTAWNHGEAHWNANIVEETEDGFYTTYDYGSTRREAAMRAYVASKLGDEVEIPDELI